MDKEPDPEEVWGSQRAQERHQEGDAGAQVPPTEDHPDCVPFGVCSGWSTKRALLGRTPRKRGTGPPRGARVKVQTWREEVQGKIRRESVRERE